MRTNFVLPIPLLVDPSLQFVAERMSGAEFNTFTEQVRDHLLDADRGKLTRLFDENSIRLAGQRALYQMVNARACFFGDFPSERLLINLALFREPEAHVSSLKAAIGNTSGEIGNESLVEPLIKTLKHKSAPLRGLAARALGFIGDLRAIEPLANALKDKRSRPARNEAIKALAHYGDKRAVDAFFSEIKHMPLLRAAGSVAAFLDIGYPLIAALIQNLENEEYARDIHHVLLTLGEPAIEPLIEALERENESIENRVVATLVAMGEPAIEPLLRHVKKRGLGTADGVISSLIHIGKPAVEPLLRTLEYEDAEVGCIAAQILGRIDDRRAVEPLNRSLASANLDLRRAAIEALTQINRLDAEYFIKILGYENEQARSLAAYALWQFFDDSRALIALAEALLKDKAWSVRAAVAEALGIIKGPRAVDPLIQALKDENPRVRMTVIRALGKIGDPRAVEPLIQKSAEEQETEDVRLMASLVLSRMRN